MLKKLVILVFMMFFVMTGTAISGGTSIYLGGDSIMESLGSYLSKERNEYKYILDGKRSTGLANDKYYNWPDRLEKQLKYYHPSIVIFCIGTNDNQNMVVNKRGLVFRSDKWEIEYQRRVSELIELIRKYDAVPFFVSPPKMINDMQLNMDVGYISWLIEQVCHEKRVNYINIYQVTHDYHKEGIYWKDGIHLNDKGCRLISKFIMNDIFGEK